MYQIYLATHRFVFVIIVYLRFSTYTFCSNLRHLRTCTRIVASISLAVSVFDVVFSSGVVLVMGSNDHEFLDPLLQGVKLPWNRCVRIHLELTFNSQVVDLGEDQ